MYRIRPRRGCTAAVLALAVAAGFTVDSVAGIPPALMPALAVAVDCVAAIHRVTGACHVIVAPFVARVAAEHGLPDCRGHTRCPTIGTLSVSSGSYVAIRS